MRGLVFPAVIAAVFAAAPLAFASETTAGVVKSFDMKAHTLTLDNGTIYYLPAGFKDPGIKDGTKVSVVWDMKYGKHEADSVTIQK